jgi:hypothetical protein
MIFPQLFAKGNKGLHGDLGHVEPTNIASPEALAKMISLIINA